MAGISRHRDMGIHESVNQQQTANRLAEAWSRFIGRSFLRSSHKGTVGLVHHLPSHHPTVGAPSHAQRNCTVARRFPVTHQPPPSFLARRWPPSESDFPPHYSSLTAPTQSRGLLLSWRLRKEGLRTATSSRWRARESSTPGGLHCLFI